ncbi:MAG: hypothetical protein U0V87_16425 [Acidobacteriota bacterium]
MGSARVHRARFDPYAGFRQLDGRHPFQARVPDGWVGYRARRIHGAQVVYFNFELAREMGLIPEEHPDRLTVALQRVILETFALQIVNEYDERNGAEVDPEDLLPGTFMATRYLQMQHPSRIGKTSGDGRSIWNGCLTTRRGGWDVSSCGTGVTRLCPATAWTKRYYKTGSRVANYGCGTASIEDGFGAALMSETLNHNGMGTERQLAILSLPNGYGINVRAGRNLLRPSHFFVHNRQGNRAGVKGVADAWIERQVLNGQLRKVRGTKRYEAMTDSIAERFGTYAALFESEYLFVWLDWDGDNVLADGGIIDYGSVRQFGLFHREYRFDDGPIWSTTITEQRLMARRIVQQFAQIRDWLISGKRKPLQRYRRDRALRRFDAAFEKTSRLRLLHHAGLEPQLAAAVLSRRPRVVERFLREHTWWERQRAARGLHAVADGITWNAVYSARDLMRQLPARWLAEPRLLSVREVLEIAASSYASRRDRMVTPSRSRRALELQRSYGALLTAAAQVGNQSPQEILRIASERSAVINRYARITGDSGNYAARRLFLARRRLSPERLYDLIRAFVVSQNLIPEREPKAAQTPRDRDARRVFDQLMQGLEYYRHSL